jgi:hypothetical protein
LRSSDRNRCNRHAETTFFPRAAGDNILDDLRAACEGMAGPYWPAATDRNRKAA